MDALRIAVSKEQSDTLKRLDEGKVIRLFLGVAKDLSSKHQEVEVRISDSTGDPRDIPTVALVIDGKRKLSAFEYVTPDGQRLFRIRQGFDDQNPDRGAAHTLDDDCKIFSGKYGHHKSLKNAREILTKAVDGYIRFYDGVSDISFRPGLAMRMLGKHTPQHESPYKVILSRHNAK